MSRPDAFRPDWLPASEPYYAKQGVEPKGRGNWRSALCQFHDERNPSLRINIDTGAFFCNGCHAKGGDVLAFHMLKYGLHFVDAARELGAWDEAQARASSPVAPVKSKQPCQRFDAGLRAFWNDLSPLCGVGVDYLQARLCKRPPADGDLRYHPALKHPSGYVGPALRSPNLVRNQSSSGSGDSPSACKAPATSPALALHLRRRAPDKARAGR